MNHLAFPTICPRSIATYIYPIASERDNSTFNSFSLHTGSNGLSAFCSKRLSTVAVELRIAEADGFYNSVNADCGASGCGVGLAAGLTEPSAYAVIPSSVHCASCSTL